MMPRRISPEIDMQILAEAGHGVPHKDIAQKYNVSPSYVSKLCTGKKRPEIYIPKNDNPEHSFNDEIEEIADLVGRRAVFASNKAAIAFVKNQLAGLIKLARIYVATIKELEKEEQLNA